MDLKIYCDVSEFRSRFLGRATNKQTKQPNQVKIYLLSNRIKILPLGLVIQNLFRQNHN